MSDLSHKNIRKLAVDVTDNESVAVGIRKVYEETEGIDLLISNAGINHTGILLNLNQIKLTALVRSSARHTI